MREKKCIYKPIFFFRSKYLIVLTLFTIQFSFNNYIFSQSGPIDGRGGGIIAFISDREGSNAIYLMNADGSYQTKVSNDNAFNFGLSWSRDGNRLAFCSTLNGGFEIYIIDVIDITEASFTDPLRITNNSVMDFSPTWSPDGLYLAFDSQFNGNPSIVIMNLDNGNITPLDTSPVNGNQPSWSPVENRIAFASSQGIYSVTTSGTGLQQVTSGYSLVPEYSPDGDKIAYVATYAAEDIFIVNSDGTDNHRITTSAENDFVPSWSPEGNRLVYEGSIAGVDQICVIDTDGTNYLQLTTAGVNTGPAWYPFVDPTSVKNDVDKLVLNDFILYQNYPNPFNPSTIISFSIPSEDFITLRVYDVLGKEVDVLVNETKPPGNYDVEFSGKNLTSGIYFYKLKAGDFVDTKKLILIK